jgi:hypothetical protein
VGLEPLLVPVGVFLEGFGDGHPLGDSGSRCFRLTREVDPQKGTSSTNCGDGAGTVLPVPVDENRDPDL